MVAGIDKISNYNFFMKPVNGVDGIGQNGGSGRARKVEGGELTGGGYNPFGAISKIDGELHPSNEGSTYLHGINQHGKKTLDLLG